MITQDDRTDEQKETHDWIVVGTDSFMSGWGKCSNGASYAGWACRFDDLDECEKMVRSRSEMKRVRVVKDPYKPNPKLCAHFHIYVFGGKR